MAEVMAGGGIYGRALKIPDEWPEPGATAGGGVRRQAPAVLKSHLVDIPTRPGQAALFSGSGMVLRDRYSGLYRGEPADRFPTSPCL